MTSLARTTLRAGCLAALVLSLPACAASAQRVDSLPPVVLDGLLGEWADVPYAAIGAPRHGYEGGPHPYGADSLAQYARVNGVAVRHDAEAVYVRLRLERPVSLQGLEGALLLMLDVDGDSASGWAEHGMRGVDAVVEFSPPWPPQEMRAGAGVRMMDSAGATPSLVSANVAGLVVAPTHAAREFELRIPRGGPIGFGPRVAIGVAWLDREGRGVDRLPVFTADLRDPAPRPTPPGAGAADPLARAPGTDVRVVSWNVGRQDLFQQPEAFGAVLRSLAPDLLLFDEVEGGHSAEEVEALLNRIVPDDRPWRAVYGTSGGSQRGVIALRGAAPAVAPAFAGELPYPDSTRAIVPAGDSMAAAWLRSRVESHVAVTGAVMEIGGRRLLAVTFDLESGGEPGSARDRLRRIEALAIRDALTAAVRAGGLDGVLLAGDVNLVASTDPLRILSAGPDVDGSGLHVPLPLRLDGASAATWERAQEVFTPGRLDFVLVGDAALTVTGGFVFRAGDLSPAWRARHGVDADTSRVTDHLPVVTDLRWGAAPR
jgi:hypothetical protein